MRNKKCTQVLLCALALLSSIGSSVATSNSPPLIVLPSDATAVTVILGKYLLGKPEVTPVVLHIAGWLVANGACAPKSRYPELAEMASAGKLYGNCNGDGTRLPSMPMWFKDGRLYKGWAINPSYATGFAPANISQFEFTPSF